MENNLLYAIAIPLSAGFVWVLYFWLYRAYRVDKFRESVFILRDSLFDLAASGKIGFDHPAYIMLRQTLNGSIRFGHRFGLLQMIVCMFVERKRMAAGYHYQVVWEQRTAELSKEVQEALEAVRANLHMRVVEQFIFTSPVLICTIVSVFAYALLYCLFKVWSDKAKSIMRRFLALPVVNGITNQYDNSTITLQAA